MRLPVQSELGQSLWLRHCSPALTPLSQEPKAWACGRGDRRPRDRHARRVSREVLESDGPHPGNGSRQVRRQLSQSRRDALVGPEAGADIVEVVVGPLREAPVAIQVSSVASGWPSNSAPVRSRFQSVGGSACFQVIRWCQPERSRFAAASVHAVVVGTVGESAVTHRLIADRAMACGSGFGFHESRR